MKRWFKIIFKVLIVVGLLIIAVYTFLPSSLTIQESIETKSPPRIIYQHLSNPNYWISRSSFFYNKLSHFHTDTTENNVIRYKWLNKDGTVGFVKPKDLRRYEMIVYQVSYDPESDGELSFNLSYKGGLTTVAVTLAIEIPNSSWKKLKAYVWHLPLRYAIRNELKSLALDCAMNTQGLNIDIKKGKISDFVASIRRTSIAKNQLHETVEQLQSSYRSIKKRSTTILPYIQYATSPYNDTLIIISGIPIVSKSMSQLPNSTLALFSEAQTIYATFNYKTVDFDDVYNLLVSKTKEMGLIVDSYPFIFFDFNNETATMQLPIDD